jgi:hypothetical protein
VLIIMHDRDIEYFAEALFNFKATRSGNILEIDSPKTWSESGNCSDDGFGILSGQDYRCGIDISKGFENSGFALHDGESGEWTDIAETENS